MRKLLLSAVAFAAVTLPAAAADMPVKAAVKPFQFPYSGQGCYFGISTKAGVDQVSTSGNALLATSLVTGSINAAGAGVGGDVGCIRSFAPGGVLTWAAIEASAYYQNVTAGAVASNGTTGVQASYASRWSANQEVKLGGFNPLQYLPNLGIQFPTLPAPPSVPGVNLIGGGHAYASAGVEEFGIDGQFFQAGGSTIGIAATLGAGLMSQIADVNGKWTGNVLDVGARVVFSDHTLAVSNFLGTGGAPTAANIALGKKYEAYINFDF